MDKKRVIIIGAGPAGLAAALSTLKEGAHVVVLEHMEEAGKKLLITGNGQCNLSNTEVGPEHYHGNQQVIRTVLDSFRYEDMISFMRSVSVETETVRYRHETCGYLYPKDHKAETVRKMLKNHILEDGGEILTGCHITHIRNENGVYQVTALEGTYEAERLVFATGSNAYPVTGSDSSIYPVLKSLGIVQKTWLPALVALKSDSVLLRELKGLRADASVSLKDLSEDTVHETKPGEVQFREHYISGLPVLQLSRYASEALHRGHEVCLKVQLKKANNKDGILPLTEAEFRITGTEGFDHAICCSGGIAEEDINGLTLESTSRKGMYFAGEMIDVDGDCGGFNLHFAIASGLLAGRNAAK